MIGTCYNIIHDPGFRRKQSICWPLVFMAFFFRPHELVISQRVAQAIEGTLTFLPDEVLITVHHPDIIQV